MQYRPLPPGLINRYGSGGGPDTHDHALDARPSGHVGWPGVGVWAAFAKLGLCTWLKGETRVAAVRAVMTSWPFNFPAAVLQSALECIEKRRARAAGAARDGEDNDDPGTGPEEFERTSTPAGTMRTRPHRRGASGRTRDFVSMGSGNRRRACLTAAPRTPQGPNVMAQTLTWRDRTTRQSAMGRAIPHQPRRNGEQGLAS